MLKKENPSGFYVDPKSGTDKAKRKRLSIDIQLLSRFTCTQTRI